MTHFKKFFDYKFISAEELDGKEVVLTIKGIHKDEAFNQKKQSKEAVPALEFKETPKMIILNITNARKISEILGSSQVETWFGKKICLYPLAISAFGQNMEAIRIKKVPNGAAAVKPEFKEIPHDNEPEPEPAAEPVMFSDTNELEGPTS